ncbi:hypothetical protein B0F90DRAFT_1812537 [Multifurca ochricompacta]|uniref:DUF221-domain-containing protein n=1 Tax=Multifurca ochricompacta TaxID=376703 RepID=A0AAD4LTI4_9AGAM|nr:hypothetical protein B0F90DRAFT_1812537 [Multifurca ochricompacta]
MSFWVTAIPTSFEAPESCDTFDVNVGLENVSDLSQSTTASTKTFVTALVLNAIIAAVEIIAFILVRRYFRLIYEPRSLSVFEAKRQPPLSPHLFGWLISIFNVDYRKIKNINGLDCYFFVRFLRMMVRVMLPIWLLSWAVLLPLTSVNTGVPGHSGLDKFIFGNIATTSQHRYAGHLLLTWIFTIWIWWNIKHEMAHYVRVRQHYLVSPAHSSTAQACTVLYLSESALTRLFSHLPGGVRKVWINRDLADMPDLYNRRLKACQMLESAETSLLNMAIKRNTRTRRRPRIIDPEARRTLFEELVPKEGRPSHRLPPFSWMPFSIPLVGKKVDTIEWARDQVHELNTQLLQRREVLARDITRTTAAEAQTTNRVHNIGAGKLNISLPMVPITIPLVGARPVVDFSDQTYPPANGAFVLFNKQIAAHMAAQTLIHHEPYRMSGSLKYVEVAPEDIIWDNLVINPYERRVRLALSWAATIGLIIVWAIPVAFVGFISNIHSLCSTYHWLEWICKAPSVVVSFIQGFLPSVLLAVLFMLVPIVLRILARLEGIPQRTGVELSLMDRFFLFQVINGFLVVTLSSGIIASLPGLVNNPTSVPTLLAQNLPKSSTFFLTFVLLQGLSGTAGGFLQAVPLAMYYIKITLLGSTPRSVYGIEFSPRTSNWGTLFPTMTQLVVITLGYSIISPIINGLAFAAFFLFYLLYKYLFTWVNDQPSSSDTGGLFFPKAIQHVFVGLYIQQVCLCALFFLAQDDHKKPSAIPEGALMIVLIVFTAFFQNTIINSYGPLIKFLPLTLAEKSYDGSAEQDVPTTENPSQPVPSSSEDVKAIDHANASAPGSQQRFTEGGSPRLDGPDASTSFTNESRASSPSPSAKPIKDEGPTDFNHPASVEEQRIIWLPKDSLGLVREIERDLDSQGVLYSTEGARMDSKGHVSVTLAPPEEVERAPREGRLPSPDEGEGDEIRDMLRVESSKA